MYAAGEELFALKSTQHPELTKTKKEACLLDQLYGLYMDVIHTLERLVSHSFLIKNMNVGSKDWWICEDANCWFVVKQGLKSSWIRTRLSWHYWNYSASLSLSALVVELQNNHQLCFV